MSLNSTFAKSFSNTERFQLNNDPLKNGQVSSDKSKTDDKNPIIRKETVSLENKPPEMPLGEHLMRQALNKLAPTYNLSEADVDLEIQYIKEKDGGKFIENLSFGKNEVVNPNDLTDVQVADLIKNGHKNVEFGIHQATIERMIKRDELVKWLARKDEFGIGISEQDKTDLAEIGYTTDDLAKFRDAKYMYYQGYRSQARAESETRFKTLNDELRQKMVAEQMAKLESRPDSDFYGDGDGEKINPDFERRRLANAAVNNLLGDKTPFEYERDKFEYERGKTEAESFEKRLAGKSYGEFLSSGSKSFINAFYGGIGGLIKGAALTAVNNSIYTDQNGKQITPKVSDTLGYKIGDWIQQNVQAPNVDKDIEQTLFGGTIPKTIGGLLPAVLGAWVTKNPQATVAVYSGLSTGGNIYDEAKSKGATESQAQKAGLLTGGFVGVTSVFGYGKTLEALNSGAGAATWKTIFSEAIKDGARNSVIAGGQTVFENGVAKQTYDPNRSYLKNVRERMIAAGITGATLKGGLEIIAKVRMGSNSQVLAETQEILKVKPEIETLTPKQIELRNSGNSLKAKLNEKLDNVSNSLKNAQTIAQKEAVKLIKQANDTEPKIMNDLKDVSKQMNGEMIGLEYRFKSEESLTRKINDRSNRVERALIKQGKTPAEAKEIALKETVSGINDALRYTMSFPKEKYYSSYAKTIETLKKQRYKVEAVADFWSKAGTRFDTGYRGINTTLISPNGQKFELQFHTPESFKLKMDTHSLYEEARIPTTSKARKDEIRKVQIEMAGKIPVPIQSR
jgi:hypothetical protein